MAAPSIVSASPIVFAFTGGNALGSVPTLPLSLTLAMPVGIAPGDLLVMFVAVDGRFPGVGAHINPIDTPATWAPYFFSSDGLNVLTHTVTGSEPGSLNVVYSGPAYNYSGFSMNATIVALRPASGSVVINAFSFSANPAVSPGTAMSADQTTTTVNDCQILVLMEPFSESGSLFAFSEPWQFIVPGDPAGTTPLVNDRAKGGANYPPTYLGSTLAMWSITQAVAGATGNFVSPTGWNPSPTTNQGGIQCVIAFGNGPGGSTNLRITQDSVEALITTGPPLNFNNEILLYTFTHKGPSPWSTYSAAFVNGAQIITIKEVQFVDPISGNEMLGVLASCTDGKIYQLFGGEQNGIVIATATTWPLPDLSQLPYELRDTMKVFRELWVEGQDIFGFELQWSTDYGVTFSPPVVLQNRMQIGANGRQIVLKITHSAAANVTPLLSYMKIDYDILGQAAGAQGAGRNY